MIKYLANNPISNAIREVRGILDPDQKKRAGIMIILLIINAVFDFAGLAAIGALIISALDSDIFSGDAYLPGEDVGEASVFFNSNLRNIYDWSGAVDEIAFLFYLSIFIFIAFLIKNAISLYIGYVQSRFSYNIALRLNKKMFKYYYDQGYLFVKDSTAGKKVYAIVDIPMRFASHFLNTLLQVGTEIVVMLIIGIALLIINPVAVLLLGVAIIPTFMLIYNFSKNRAKDIGMQRNELSPINYGRVLEAMNGYVDVKLGNIENQMLEKYEETQRKLNRVDTIFFGIYHKLNQRTNDIIFGMGILVIFGFAHFFGMDKTEVLSLLGLFAIAAYKFLPGINRLMNSLLTMKNSSFVFKELKKIKNVELSRFHESEAISFNHSLAIKNIFFKYPVGTENVLNDINLIIRKGTTVGFIGTSGSGKTTLLKILLRLLQEQSGSIHVDGISIEEENESAYQKIIGYVEQEIFILNDTILNNIAFGEDQPNIIKAQECLKDSQLADFVNNHPDGLEMKLGENGVNLSGGQKQRIGIARALYKDSEILMFDEATSALDSDTERAVVESINHLSNIGKTVIIVAHRLTTLEKCDYIYELDQGKIVGEHLYHKLIIDRVLHQ